MINRYITLAIALIVGFSISYYLIGAFEKSSLHENNENVSILYSCNEGKTVNAVYSFSKTEPKTPPTGMPVPKGSVNVTLSDGRFLSLAQTISASGVRFSNSDESFVFWNKGKGALVLENNTEKSYIGCVEVGPKPQGSNLTEIFSSGSNEFSLRLPLGYLSDSSYVYQMTSTASIGGVKFTIPAKFADGTNLGHDTYLSVERLPGAQECSGSAFLYGAPQAKQYSENGTTYSVASSTGAGAGNRYEETVYAIPGTSPCLAVRYFIHYGVFENYPKGTIKEWDKNALLREFDSIRSTLIYN